MKIWRWVFATIGWLGVVLAGFGALLIALAPNDAPLAAVYKICEYFGLQYLRLEAAEGGMSLASEIGFWVVGIGLLLVAALSLVTPLGHPRGARLLEFPTESGKVQVDITALEACLAHVVGEEEGVIRARVHLRGGTAGGKAPLGCTATIWFEAGPDVIGKVSAIQARMRAYYYQVLPVKDPVKIDIRTKLVYQKTSARTIETLPPAEAAAKSSESARLLATEDDYSGPQYPTGGAADPGEESSPS
jgi:hypothetical protein